MKRCNFIMSLPLLFSVVLFFSSCESSKIAFGNSYYFKQTPKKTNDKQLIAEVPDLEDQQNTTDQNGINAQHAYVSTEVLAAEKSIQEKIENVANKMERIKALKEQENIRKENNIKLQKAEQKEFKKEQKAEQRALKKEIKALTKEYKKAPEALKKQNDVSGNTRTGIILGAVGLVLLIIGGPALWTIGTILVVVGLVLILLDVL